MEKNFSVGDAIELVVGGVRYDLHNWYDFEGIVVLSEALAQLWFRSHNGNEPSLVLEINGVTDLEVSSGVLMGRCRDVEEIGYKHPSDRDLDWLVAEERSTKRDHLVFRFGIDDYIRIHGERAGLFTRENSSSLSRLSRLA
ncbi:MAG TPA: hypothetical protein VGD74_04480 [Vulgatibacter sp.]